MKFIPVDNIPTDVVEDVVGALDLAGESDKALSLQKSVDRGRNGMRLLPATFSLSVDGADLTAGAIGAFLMKEYGVDFMADKFPMFDSTLGTWILVTIGAAGAVISWRIINHQVLGRLAGVGKYAALHEEDVREELKAKTGEKRVSENRARVSNSKIGTRLLGQARAADEDEDAEVIEELDDDTVLTAGMLKDLAPTIVSQLMAQAVAEPEQETEKAATPTTVSRKPKVRKVKKAASGS
tara:strand:- start:70 stop:786 length:717 start_codon:yes stop_codon:yes gene_type:complete